MTVYSILPLVTGFCILAIGGFVLRYRSDAIQNRVFFGLCFSVFIWTLGYSVLYTAKNEQLALAAAQFGYLGVVFIPSTTFHFVAEFINVNRKNRFIAMHYLLSVFFLMLVFQPSFISGTASFFWGGYPIAGPLYGLFIGYFVLMFGYCVVVLYLNLKKQKADNRQAGYYQTKCVFFAFLIASCSVVDYVPNYGVAIYPYGYLCALGWIGFISYAITRYRLMDISVIIKKTLVFAGLLAFVFGVFSAATFFVRELLARFGMGKVSTYAVSLILIVAGFDTIRNFLINLTDKYLFQKKYDYQKILKDATRGMSKIESLNHLLGLVVHFVTMKMRVKNTAIMMRRRDNEYELGFQRGFSRNFLEYRLDDANPMIAYLMAEKEAFAVETIREYIEAGNKKHVKGEKPHEYDFQAIYLTMQSVQAAAVIPSFLGHELRSILLVGEKKSGDFFTQDDLTLLYTLAQESAIAIENAKLFDEAVNKSNQLAKINEQLEYSRNLLMKALRETEIANKQLQDTQAQLIHEQKMATLGRLAASVGHEVNNPLTILSMNVSRAILKYRKNPDLKVGEVLELFQKMEQNIGRIKAVVNTLTGLLKKSEKGKFEPLSLKLILEETLPLVQFQTYLDNLSGTEVEFDVPGNTPLIRGDLERLQEVFLNLFINAYHAMQGRRNRRIRVTAEADAGNQSRVAVHFADNGCGMTEEVMRKIFNYGFTTKPPGRGSGMGLYMCKYIVELHGGEMKVESKIGEGTTFTIYLPAYEESAGETGGVRLEANS